MHDPYVVAFQIRRPWPKRRDSHGWRYWPKLVTVWHHEPGGRDSGEVCKHYRHDRATGKTTILHGWKWHIHHWRVQVPPLQDLRRWALTHCAWCGGRSAKRDPVGHSMQWDGPRGRWWRGEPGLYHSDCASAYVAHRTCLCADPVLEHDGWGRCYRCGKQRSYGLSAEALEVRRRCAIVKVGARPGRPADTGQETPTA